MDFNKPRVSIWYYVVPQTGYRNDGAPLFMNGNLRKLLNGTNLLENPRMMGDDGGNVVHLQPNMPAGQHGTFDLNILIDHGEDVIGVPLDFKVPSPNAYWAFDTHIDSKGCQYRLNRAKEFDHVFLCHSGQIESFIKDGIPEDRVHYLPVAAEPTCYRPFPILEKWDWCFIGHMNNSFRVDLIDRFCKEWPVGEKGYLGWRMGPIQGHNVLEDAAKKFCQSRIVLNESIKDDLNMRTFEAMACKRCLLTESVPPLHELFEEGKHLVTFKTIDEAVDAARYLLADDERRTAIAEAGYQEILAKHTYMHRVKEILKTCIGYVPEEEKVIA